MALMDPARTVWSAHWPPLPLAAVTHFRRILPQAQYQLVLLKYIPVRLAMAMDKWLVRLVRLSLQPQARMVRARVLIHQIIL